LDLLTSRGSSKLQLLVTTVERASSSFRRGEKLEQELSKEWLKLESDDSSETFLFSKYN